MNRIYIIFSLSMFAAMTFGCNDIDTSTDESPKDNIDPISDDPTRDDPEDSSDPIVDPEPIDEPDPIVDPEPIDEPDPIVDPEPIDEPDPVDPDPEDPCHHTCQQGEVCNTKTGSCMQICGKGLTLCDESCVNLNVLHLESCSACAANYCDSDDNLHNGCEIYSLGNDINHCGACGHACSEGEKCESGVCTEICEEGSIDCHGVCKNFSELHLETCESCAEDFFDCDGDAHNGCEASILSDFEHCGACNQRCAIGDMCNSGVCENTYSVHRRLVVDEENSTDKSLNVLEAPNSDTILGSLKVYEYFKALGEQNTTDGEVQKTWYLLDFDGQPGWVEGFYTMDVCDDCAGRKAVDFAEKYLWTPENPMCTHDYYGEIPYLTNGADTHGNYYNNNCANFVTAILMNVGLINKHFDQVSQLKQYCIREKEGYRRIEFADAKPGDIWMERDETHSHTELVVGSWNGGTHIITIGSMSFTSCGEDGVKTMDLSGMFQRVSYTDRVNEGDFVYIFSRH